ncbi:MAG: 3-methyladenine DNA glycosylase [Campylobacterales bacterium]|nr:3-methyladenine DNA glycosylase [Campylobacterales bacterium]
MQSSYDLLYALKVMEYLQTTRDPFWWPHSGSVEVIIGAILTQQTKWEKVELSLEHLHAHDLCTLKALSTTNLSVIAKLIQPSGFYNTKAQRLQRLCQNILKDFGDFETFAQEVDREWLLSQKGIGMESADSILCYACKRDVMVIDSYTQRLLEALGYAFESYMQIQEWMQEGIESNWEKVQQLYDHPVTLQTVYARFHGKIVEFAKKHIKGKKVDTTQLEALMEKGKEI